MTESSFRRLALSMTGVEERAHMAHPDFRVAGKIFATLHGDGLHAMVKLAPDDQAEFVREHPLAFAPENGAWGRQGCTRVRLDSVMEEPLGRALTLAWQRIASESASRKRARPRNRTSAPGRTSPRKRATPHRRRRR